MVIQIVAIIGAVGVAHQDYYLIASVAMRIDTAGLLQDAMASNQKPVGGGKEFLWPSEKNVPNCMKMIPSA